MPSPLRPQAIALLTRLGSGETDQSIWNPLWDELYHQHAALDACAALPSLANAATNGMPAARSEAIALAAGVLINAGAGNAEIRRRYATAISALLHEAQSDLTRPADEDDYAPQDFVGHLQAVLAFEDQTSWASKLICLTDEELEIDCPTCGTAIVVALGRDGLFTCTVDYGLGRVASAALVPADPKALTGIGARLHALATAARQPATARQLTALFGSGTCLPDGHHFVPGHEM
ncbi:hypothetical protein ACFVUS_26175 [Nocardia sp. NPDC058058]|uniref:hypothetical protein n=1 Tax=Nocardia sp. NPDC058058 TaxID=3346317 RepID=UPI0036D79B21